MLFRSITETDRRIHLLDESLKEIETKGQVAVDAKDMGTAFRLYNESQEIKERKQEMNDKKEFFKDFDER